MEPVVKCTERAEAEDEFNGKSSSRQNQDYDEAVFRATARENHELHKDLQAQLNPAEFEQAATIIFGGDKDAEELLGKFSIHEEIYETVWPDEDKCPASMRNIMVEEMGQIHVDLKMFIAIPKHLLGTTSAIRIKPAIRFHGGGGMTGHPMFPDWIYQADLEYVLQATDMVSVEPTYCLMPEASGTMILRNLRNICTWLFEKLEPALQSVNPNFIVAWDYLYIFGISFGGLMAMGLFLETGRQRNKPTDLHIRALILRCPVIKEYRREPGEYMGITVSKERADEDSKRLLTIKGKMAFTVQRAGSNPPEGMYGAYCFSVSHQYGTVWREKTMFAMVEETQKCPDSRTRIRIMHGTEDKNVPMTHSFDVQTLFKAKGWSKIDVVPQKGKPHAWDCNEPLTDDLKEYLDQS